MRCELFRQFDDEKHWKNRRWHVQLMLLEQVLAQWWHPLVSTEALDLLHWAMCAVSYCRIPMAIKTASFVGVFVDCCLLACCPGECWGNTKRVVTQCWRPVASRVALDMPHWAMPSVLLRRTAVAIQTASRQGAFVHHCQFCHWSFKTKTKTW